MARKIKGLSPSTFDNGFVSEGDARRLEEGRQRKRDAEFFRARITGILTKITGGDYTAREVNDLWEFLERARETDSGMDYFVEAEKEYEKRITKD